MYHFIGIKDKEMSALAQIIHSLGYKIQGSDNKDYSYTEDLLKEKGIKVLPFAVKNIHEDMIIVKGEDISEDNEELKRAQELGLKIYSWQQMTKKFTSMFQSILVSGCIGKSITTYMMAYVLADIIGCNYLIRDGRGYADRDNKYFCLQASENKRKFLEYDSYYSIITNIDYNYTDYYKNIDDVISAYQEFANRAEKMVIACGDDQYTHMLNVNPPIFYYGLNDDNDIIAKNVEYRKDGTSFEVFVEDNYYGTLDLPIYGKQMLLNVLAVLGISYYERLEIKQVAKALKEFFTKHQVFQEKIFQEVVTINHFANHPNELKASLKAIKQKYPDKKIVAVFNPNQLLDEPALVEDFMSALNLFDKNYIIEDDMSVNFAFAKELKELNNKEYLNFENVDKLAKVKNTVLMFVSDQKSNSIQTEFEEHLEKESKKSHK